MRTVSFGAPFKIEKLLNWGRIAVDPKATVPFLINDLREDIFYFEFMS